MNNFSVSPYLKQNQVFIAIVALSLSHPIGKGKKKKMAKSVGDRRWGGVTVYV